jgi:hypothetical protein
VAGGATVATASNFKKERNGTSTSGMIMRTAVVLVLTKRKRCTSVTGAWEREHVWQVCCYTVAQLQGI